MTIKEQSSAIPYGPRFGVALGVPLIVSADVPVGKLQFWQDGKMVREIDV